MTIRSNKLIAKAKIVPYTKKELDLLLEALEDRELVQMQVAFGSGAMDKEEYDFNYFHVITNIKTCRDKNFIKCSLVSNDDRTLAFYSSTSSIINNNQSIVQGIIKSGGSKLNLMQYLMLFHLKIFLLLAIVPIECMPLYLNRGYLAPFAAWRLKINK